ncbi:hypothetical protein KIN20_014920 [Parelaphostrongylus tenuis]|uniref:Uncharacterized protein n=1 Tax=Parelaphostrongylus tenuis TaxID=148309 RepID=A0AAD5QS59_PARTN|nr:hypothetical protein KIN20_014920 [Parelaphostrongylus tenuis]
MTDRSIAIIKEIRESESELNLALELRWEPWGECVGSRHLQKREAHCYLVRKYGYQIPDQGLEEEHKWMAKLNSLFNHEPFASKGIRLYSSLLASLFVDENVMKKCHYQTKRAQVDRIWRLILRTMVGHYKGGKFNHTMVEVDEDGDVVQNPPTFRLTNPFHACMTYDYNNESRIEHFVGTYMTETRPCTTENAQKP